MGRQWTTCYRLVWEALNLSPQSCVVGGEPILLVVVGEHIKDFCGSRWTYHRFLGVVGYPIIDLCSRQWTYHISVWRAVNLPLSVAPTPSAGGESSSPWPTYTGIPHCLCPQISGSPFWRSNTCQVCYPVCRKLNHNALRPQKIYTKQITKQITRSIQAQFVENEKKFCNKLINDI